MPLYSIDPDDSSKLVPTARDGSKYSTADCPTNDIVAKRAGYVNINKVGTYAFLYETTASIGGTTTQQLHNYVTGSVVQNAAAGGIKLDINPVAWRRCDAADVIGDITFVYVRVR